MNSMVRRPYVYCPIFLLLNSVDWHEARTRLDSTGTSLRQFWDLDELSRDLVAASLDSSTAILHLGCI